MAEYIAECLKAAGANYALTGALGSTLSLRGHGPMVEKPHRLLTLAAASAVTDGDVRFGNPKLARAVYAAAAGAVGSISVTPSLPPAIIPVSTVEHDNRCLVYGAGTCASGPACVGAGLDGAPGPLDAYVLPGTQIRTATMHCLLCIRCDATALSSVYSEVVKHEPKSGVRASIIVPPFQNLVNVPNGYYSAACGVTPSSGVFSPVHIAGCNFPLRVIERDGVLAVDQDAGVWTPDNHFLGFGPDRLPQGGSQRGQPPSVGGFPKSRAGAELSRRPGPATKAPPQCAQKPRRT
jgi:hypothetical protein